MVELFFENICYNCWLQMPEQSKKKHRLLRPSLSNWKTKKITSWQLCCPYQEVVPEKIWFLTWEIQVKRNAREKTQMNLRGKNMALRNAKLLIHLRSVVNWKWKQWFNVNSMFKLISKFWRKGVGWLFAMLFAQHKHKQPNNIETSRINEAKSNTWCET